MNKTYIPVILRHFLVDAAREVLLLAMTHVNSLKQLHGRSYSSTFCKRFMDLTLKYG